MRLNKAQQAAPGKVVFHLSLVFLFSGIFSGVTAQQDTVHALPMVKDFRTVDIGFHFGVTDAYTDISGRDFFKGNLGDQLAYGLSVTKFFSHNVGLQGRFITGKMSGKDKEKPTEYFFTTKIKFDASLNVVFQIGNISFLKRNPCLAIYGYVGVGEMYFDPGKSWYVEDYLVLTDTTHPSVNYHNTKELVFPFGIGLKYRLNKDFSLSAEYSLRLTNSDKLDGYFRQLSGNDSYAYYNLGLIYHIGKKEKVLEWDNPVDELYADLASAKNKADLLTRDSDNDGVADYFDKEPNTPPNVKVYGDGTSVDSDGDGIPDYKDAEPFSANGAKVDLNGKELDSDEDGVPDRCDLEQNTVKGSTVNKDGVTITPSIQETSEKTGNTSVSISNLYLPSVFFDLNKADIQKKYFEALASVALIMRNNPALKFTVVGNCDISASEEYNKELGSRRAKAVKDHLTKKYGIDPSRLKTITKEKKEPITSQDDAMNRRVDFVVTH